MTDDELFEAARNLRRRAENAIAAQRVAAVRAGGAFAGQRLTADEKLVLVWYRETKRRHAAEVTRNDCVSILLAGRPSAVGWIDRQLDHLGSELFSSTHGREVAHFTHFQRGPLLEPLRAKLSVREALLALASGQPGTECDPPQFLP